MPAPKEIANLFSDPNQRKRAMRWAKRIGLDWGMPAVQQLVAKLFHDKEGASRSLPPGFWDCDKQRKRVYRMIGKGRRV